MRITLKNIRSDREKISVLRFVLFCAAFLLLGAAAGALSKVADRYSEIFGNFTSGMCCWIFLGVVICTFTKSPYRAAAYEFLFCAGMIAAYYLTAKLADWYYSVSFAKGWAVFTLITPIFSLIAWCSRGREKPAWVLRTGILAAMTAAVFLMSGGIVLDAVSVIAAAFIMIKFGEKENGDKRSEK